MEAAGPSQRPFASSKLYDVFINHRGPDVKNTLAIQLYKSLEETGCRAFLDSQEMEEGDHFPSAIENAIWSSTVQIAIFSKRYAESFWCLEELCLMLETKVKLIPVFYDVAPQDLRYIQKGEYAPAFENYEKKGRYPEKLQRWKNSLNEASLFTGYDLSKDNNLDYEEQCKKIASKVSEEVVKTRPPIEVAKYPVGLNELVEAFERRCQMGSGQKVGMVGIFGSGGMGKTTLAKELFNRKRSQYSKSCFLSDVREASSKGELPNLQSKLLHDLLKEKFTFQFQNNDERKSYLRRCLKNSQSKHFLLVVDDIDNPNQLDSLLEIDSLPSGSLVLITTRDEGVLKKTGITLRYKMPRMKEEHSKELFCLHAFRQRCPASGHEVLVESFVKVCAGLPLSLRVLGGHVHGHEKHYWQLELDKVSKMLPDDIIGILKVSFEALESEQQQIFMDIACFFEGKSKNTAMTIWEGSGWNGEHALYTLIEKCLVEVESRDDDQRFYYQFDSLVLKMHDSLRDLGRRMADEGGERDNPRRIWRPRDLQSWGLKGFRNILTEAKVQSFRCLINLTSDTDTGTWLGYFLGNSNNSAQTSTSLLCLRLMKEGGQLNSIPSWIPMQNLQCLSILQEPCSLWQNICQRRLRVLTSHNTQLWKSVAQRIPSEFTTVIGRAGDAAGSIINENLFSQVIGLDAVSEIQINENGDMEAFLKFPQSLSDIIVCAVVQSPWRNQLHAPPHMNVSRYMRSSLANGEWILTIALSTGGDIDKINNRLSIVGGIQQFVHYIDGFFDDDAKIKSGYIATVKKSEEWKTTHIFRNIISSAYQVM